MKPLTLLLSCGIAAGLLHAGTDALAGTFFYPGYDFLSRQVSELSAIGAPSQALWSAMAYAYGALMLGFAAGVWAAGAKRPSLRIASVLMALFALNSVLWPVLAPMHLRGTVTLATDAVHLVFTVSAITLMLGFIAFGAIAMGRGFRVFSAGVVVAMLAAGGVVGTQAASIAAGEPTPWMGLIERISVYSPMVWVAVLAVLLIRTSASAHPQAPR
jgi:hypothetical protein